MFHGRSLNDLYTSMSGPTTFRLAEDLTEQIDRLRAKRQDPTRSDTIRFLLLRAMAQLDVLTKEQKRALGVIDAS